MSLLISFRLFCSLYIQRNKYIFKGILYKTVFFFYLTNKTGELTIKTVALQTSLRQFWIQALGKTNSDFLSHFVLLLLLTMSQRYCKSKKASKADHQITTSYKPPIFSSSNENLHSGTISLIPFYSSKISSVISIKITHKYNSIYPQKAS